VKKEDCKIEMNPKELEVTVKLDTSEYVMDIELCDEIVPNDSKFTIVSTKIEIVLKKLQNTKWPTLEKGESPQQYGNVNPPPQETKKKEKNWDKLTKEIDKETKEEGNVNTFFQDIFKSSDEDQRRAIEKSFYESGGTVLSTNWKDVGAKYVEGSAPQGQEMKYWKDDH